MNLVEMCPDALRKRLKALEKSVVYGNWERAQFLELLEPRGATLLGKDEEVQKVNKKVWDWIRKRAQTAAGRQLVAVMVDVVVYGGEEWWQWCWISLSWTFSPTLPPFPRLL